MSHDFKIKRTPEQGHTRACLAKAIVTSVQGWVEADDITDFDFRSAAQDNAFLTEADEWLASGTVECICPDHTISVGDDWWTEANADDTLQHVAICTCGWKHGNLDTKADAVHAADAHAHEAITKGEIAIVRVKKES
jgi:hypothetical protein